VLVWEPMVGHILGFSAPVVPGARYIPFIFGTILYLYGGRVFLEGAADELAARRPGMMTLISLAISVAFAYSVATTFFLAGDSFYWELATLIDIMLAGHWAELRAISSARDALSALAKLLPDTAERLQGDTVELVPVSTLRVGDVVLVRPGARVPADGEVAEGESNVDESMITGESRPVGKATGDPVVAGTVNGEGSLRVRVTKVGDETALAGIIRLVREAQASRSNAQALADRAASWLVIVALVAGAITLAAWLAAGEGAPYALARTVAVLVTACPHALGLAIPLVLAISTTLAAQSGFLVRDRLALEQAREIDWVVFDKTGTLTRGEQGVTDVLAAEGLTDDAALALAAALESDSEHAIARAIVGEARRRALALPEARDFAATAGTGVRATVDGRDLRLGGPRLLQTLGVTLPPDFAEATARWGAEGKTVVVLLEGDAPLAALGLADQIRPESREAVSALRERGVRVAMLTGDSEDVARWVAGELGIDQAFAQVLPADKAAKIASLQADGSRVAMVGDGVNDAPALARADVGIAIGAGTDVAIESADIVLARDDPRDVVRIIDLSQASYRKMQQNLFWATGYNVVAIPLAAGLAAPLGFVLSPAVGAILMSTSTIIVALNAQTLRRLRLDRL